MSILYHASNGLFFERVPEGIRVVKTQDGQTPVDTAHPIVLDMVVSPESFASVFAAMCLPGAAETSRYWKAKAMLDGQDVAVDRPSPFTAMDYVGGATPASPAPFAFLKKK